MSTYYSTRKTKKNMRAILLLFIIAVITCTACIEEEKDVCTTCTLYDDINHTSGDVHTVCLTKSTMENYIEELYSFNDAQHHWVCTDPE